MTQKRWLKRKLADLREQIAANRAFDPDHQATRQDLDELRKLLVIYRYLEQQLREREELAVTNREDAVALAS